MLQAWALAIPASMHACILLITRHWGEALCADVRTCQIKTRIPPPANAFCPPQPPTIKTIETCINQCSSLSWRPWLSPPPQHPIPLPHALALLGPFNVTSLDRGNWPRAPWVQPMDESASIAIEHYGRHVCGDGDAPCEARAIDGLERIEQVVDDEYAMGRGKVGSFRDGPVVLEKAVPKIVVEDLAVVLGKLMTRYGARELMNAAVVNYGTLAATFELTVPGIKGG